MSRILLVEDDTMIASGILYALETEGYETNHATGIKDAGSLIEHYNFDLAIIDMQLPDGTGFDVSEIFKNNATSVIFLTVVDDENTIVRAFDEGAQDYIVKPFRIQGTFGESSAHFICQYQKWREGQHNLYGSCSHPYR